ncbi:hypothetical protein AB0O07_35970 [Streptomyces sp. NPDC093085]|uniref:hypothetical protein n=1 Tax=Streptomyces sp. NPDC093085 TaxID=3155068 RepID=UPI00341524E3
MTTTITPPPASPCPPPAPSCPPPAPSCPLLASPCPPPRPRPFTATGPDITLPAEFRAFHALHHHAYLSYATAHTPAHTPALAADLVRDVFGHLAVHWSALLRSSNPTATAWDHVAAHIARRTPRLLLRTTSPLQYQLTVLHHLAGLSVTAAAETTGREHATVRCLLQAPHHRPPAGRPRPVFDPPCTFPAGAFAQGTA